MKPKAPKESVQIETQKIDIKSRLGYYSEFVTAYELAVIIDKNGGQLTSRSKINKLKSDMNARKSELMKYIPKNKQDELKRQESAGKVIAKQMFEDLILNGKEGNDYHTLEFDINLSGDSAKGVAKADIVLTVKRPSKKKIVDQIAASLKAYKSPNINLANSTFTSLLQKLSGDKDYENKALSKFESIIFSGMVDEYMKIKKIKDRKMAEETVGSGAEFLKKEGTQLFNKLKLAGRKASKESHKSVAKLIIKEFEDIYSKNKKNVNKNMLSLIGMDGEDDFYAAIGTAGKQKVLSSRQSKEMKTFLDSVKENKMNIKMLPSNSGNAIDVSILLEKEEIAKSSISFTDTGVGSGGMTKSKGAGKTNFWFNVKTFL
jgi:hypothetical protein